MPRSKKPPLYNIWSSMKDRCYNPNNTGYANYGGRGIRVCEEWRNSYNAFAAALGERPSTDHSIDRIDNDGNYEPGNVRWATRREQLMNRRNALFVEIGGTAYRVIDLARLSGHFMTTIVERAKKGMTYEEVIYPGKYVAAIDAEWRQKLGDARRAKTHCRNGHEYTAENTLNHPRGRDCRICNRAAKARYRAKGRH